MTKKDRIEDGVFQLLSGKPDIILLEPDVQKQFIDAAVNLATAIIIEIDHRDITDTL